MNALFKTPDLNPDVPDILSGMSFASDFRHWIGASGRRYLTRAFPLDRASDFPGAPVVLAAVDANGRREAVWIGISVGRRFEEALEAARAAGATEAHVHLVATGALARVRVLRDLRAAMRPMRCAPENSVGDKSVLTPGEIAA
jgi:hypothetical protein